MEEFDDEEIAIALMCGKEEGIEQLIRAHGKRVSGYLRKKYPSIPKDDRLLVLRHAAFKANRKKEQFDPEKGTGGAWLLRIADNCMKDMLRDGKTDFRKDVKGEIDSLEDTKAKRPFEEKESEQDHGLDDMKKALYESIEGLTPRLRETALADLAADGKANDVDMAERMGIAESSVRKNRQRYRDEIRIAMQKQGYTNIGRAR